MGLCVSCGKPKTRFKGSNSQICKHTHHCQLHIESTTNLSSNHHQHHHRRRHSQETQRVVAAAAAAATVSCSNCLNSNRRASTSSSSNSTTTTTTTATTNNNNNNNNNRYRQDHTMAGSFPNKAITEKLRGLVSKNRNRYKQDGFNLDLTYITNSIIAMGYPASNIESVYRNNIEDVVKFLDQKHPDHYMIYNLCSERSYDKSKFHNRVRNFPFDDHNPPRIELVQPFCQDVKEWLEKDKKNVAVVHCKAGKGRTGTMICCYLLHSKICSTANEALNLYGEKRTQDTKGVTIPSQVRYVKYYERLVTHQLNYTPVTLYIKEFIFNPVPTFAGGPGNLSFTITKTYSPNASAAGSTGSGSFDGIDDCDNNKMKKQRWKSDIYRIPTESTLSANNSTTTTTTGNSCGGDGGGPPSNSFSIKLDCCYRLTGDVKIEFYNKVMMGKEKLFHFWFNTFFLAEKTNHHSTSMDMNNGYNNKTFCNNTSTTGEDCYEFVFKKNELDKLNKKDKQHKNFNENFKLTMIVQKILRVEKTLSYSQLPQSPPQIVHINNTTPTDSSAESTEEDSEEDEWDSAVIRLDSADNELFDPRGVGYRILSECEIASQLASSNQATGKVVAATAGGGGGGANAGATSGTLKDRTEVLMV